MGNPDVKVSVEGQAFIDAARTIGVPVMRNFFVDALDSLRSQGEAPGYRDSDYPVSVDIPDPDHVVFRYGGFGPYTLEFVVADQLLRNQEPVIDD